MKFFGVGYFARKNYSTLVLIRITMRI